MRMSISPRSYAASVSASLTGGGAAGNGLGFQPGGTELAREVVSVVDARGIDDARGRVETVAVEGGGCLVQGLVVEDLRQLGLVEVAADDRHRVDRRSGRDAQVA